MDLYGEIGAKVVSLPNLLTDRVVLILGAGHTDDNTSGLQMFTHLQSDGEVSVLFPDVFVCTGVGTTMADSNKNANAHNSKSPFYVLPIRKDAPRRVRLAS